MIKMVVLTINGSVFEFDNSVAIAHFLCDCHEPANDVSRRIILEYGEKILWTVYLIYGLVKTASL